MGVETAGLIPITGLSASGAADHTGSWNEDVDLAAFATVPPGTTGVILCIENTSSSALWTGVRAPGKTTPHFMGDHEGRRQFWQAAPIVDGKLDLYCEHAANVRFSIVAFVDWTFFDIDAGLPAIESTLSSWQAVTVSSVPAGTAGVVAQNFIGGWRPTGESEGIPATGNNPGSSAIVRLDSARQVDVNTGVTNDLIAYFGSAGVTWLPWLAEDEEPVWDGTWREGASAWPNGALMCGHTVGKAGATDSFYVRPGGSEWGLSSYGTNHRTMGAHIYAPLNTEGVYEYNARSGSSGSFFPFVVFAPEAAVGPAITVHPSPASVAAPAPANFNVSASGEGTLNYQWQYDDGGGWANVDFGAGGTTNSFSTGATTVAMDGYLFRCVVTDDNGPTESNAATLTVNAAELVVGLRFQLIANGVPVASETDISVQIQDGFPLGEGDVLWMGAVSTDENGFVEIDLSELDPVPSAEDKVSIAMLSDDETVGRVFPAWVVEDINDAEANSLVEPEE